MLRVKELLIKLLNDIQHIKQKLNKSIIVSNFIMTSAKQCNARPVLFRSGLTTIPREEAMVC